MNPTDVIDQPKKSRLTLAAYFAMGVVALCGVFLLIPSSKSVREGKAFKKLDTEFAAPKGFIPMDGGHFVDRENRPVNILHSDEAQIIVVAPKPKEFVPQNFIERMTSYRATGDKSKQVCLLAPDPGNTEWSLIAKVWIAQSIDGKNKKHQKFLVNNLSYTLSPTFPSGFGTSGAKTPVLMMTIAPQTIKDLGKQWADFDPAIQSKTEEILAENRKLVGSMTGFHQLFQDGNGRNYEVKPTSNFYEFENARRDAGLDPRYR